MKNFTFKYMFIILIVILSTFLIGFTVMADSNSTIPYGGVSHNIFEITEINNYVQENYPQLGKVRSAQSVFVGSRRWQNEDFAVGIEVERLSANWRNSDISAVEAITTGYLATAYYRINDIFCIKGAAGAYSSRLNIYNDIDRSYMGLDFGYKVGLYIPVSTENLDEYLPFDVNNQISGDAYIAYRFSRVGIDNDAIDAVDFSGLEISASLNISF